VEDCLVRKLSIIQSRSVSESEYKSGTTAGSKWGCGAAGVIGVPLFCFLVLIDALGDCAPDTACKKGFLPFVVTPTVLTAAVLFFVVRLIVNRLSRLRADD
jgi:hypothetical protein